MSPEATQEDGLGGQTCSNQWWQVHLSTEAKIKGSRNTRKTPLPVCAPCTLKVGHEDLKGVNFYNKPFGFHRRTALSTGRSGSRSGEAAVLWEPRALRRPRPTAPRMWGVAGRTGRWVAAPREREDEPLPRLLPQGRARPARRRASLATRRPGADGLPARLLGAGTPPAAGPTADVTSGAGSGSSPGRRSALPRREQRRPRPARRVSGSSGLPRGWRPAFQREFVDSSGRGAGGEQRHDGALPAPRSESARSPAEPWPGPDRGLPVPGAAPPEPGGHPAFVRAAGRARRPREPAGPAPRLPPGWPVWFRGVCLSRTPCSLCTRGWRLPRMPSARGTGQVPCGPAVCRERPAHTPSTVCRGFVRFVLLILATDV